MQNAFSLEERFYGVQPAFVITALVILGHSFDGVAELVERVHAFAQKSAIERKDAGFPFVVEGLSIR
jgi:hypothetical protein